MPKSLPKHKSIRFLSKVLLVGAILPAFFIAKVHFQFAKTNEYFFQAVTTIHNPSQVGIARDINIGLESNTALSSANAQRIQVIKKALKNNLVHFEESPWYAPFSSGGLPTSVLSGQTMSEKYLSGLWVGLGATVIFFFGISQWSYVYLLRRESFEKKEQRRVRSLSPPHNFQMDLVFEKTALCPERFSAVYRAIR